MLLFFIYILVWIILNLVNATMHTENLYNALHYHIIQYATMCLASYKQSFIPYEDTFLNTLNSLALHKVFICVHVLSLKVEISTS